MSDLGKNIRKFRHGKKLSQRDMEEKSGIKREYLSKLENGELKNPTLSTLIKLSDALGIDLPRLITDDEPLPNKSLTINIDAPKKTQKAIKGSFFASPILNPKTAAINPSFLSENEIEDYALIQYAWVEEKDATARYRCIYTDQNDNSMAPTISPKSIVCFDTYQNDPKKLHHKIVVLSNSDKLAVPRRLILTDKHILALPVNLNDNSIEIYSKENSPIIGKVVLTIQNVNPSKLE